MFIGWFIAAIANGIVLALYAARTPKMGAFTLVGGINGLAFMLTGHYFWTLLGSIIPVSYTHLTLPTTPYV